MRTDQLTDVFVKHLGARKDGAAFVLPSDSDAMLYVGLEGETLTISRLARLEPADTLIFIDTQKGERYVVAAEDVRAIRLDRQAESRRGGAGFGK
jgi:hypothetical protein